MRWRKRTGRRPAEAQLDAELRDHMDRQIADYVGAGMSEPEARRRARLDFGGLDQVKELCRDVRRTRFIEDLLRDIGYALRVLRKSPGFTFAAVISLALGIGANTAIFSLIDAAMLRSLPVKEPDRLIELLTDRGTGRPFNAFSYPALRHFREHSTTIEAVIASHSTRFFVAAGNAGPDPEFGAGQYVTGDFFSVLGVFPHRGRMLQPSDDRTDAPTVAVLSHAYWQRRFGADPAIVGRGVTLDDHAFTIVGITPPAFRGMQVGKEVDFWIPLSTERMLRKTSWTTSAGYKWLQLVGRVKPGHTFEQARAELQTVFQTGVVEAELALLKEENPRHPARSWRLKVEPARAGLSMIRQEYSEALLVLLGVSGIVLIIACVNVANLLLARASARRHEVAVRLSLGAGRSRVVRQLLTESMLLAVAGGAFGVALAYVGSQYLLAFFATGRTRITLEVQPDVRVLVFTAALAMATALMFGLAPARRATLVAPGTPLLGHGRVRGNREGRLLSRALIASQVALSVVMLVTAGLLLRSLHNLRTIDTGFDSSSVLLLTTDASRSRLTPEAHGAALREALSRLGALPGVDSASLCWVAPILGGGSMRTVLLEGEERLPARQMRDVYLNWVSPGYFATMRTLIHSGRDFVWRDAAGSPRVAIVNQTLARQHFGQKTALGRRVTLDAATYEVVGVVGDAKYLELRAAAPPTLYLNAFQRDDSAGEFAIRTAGQPHAIAAAARETIRAVAPSIAVTRVRTLAEQVDASIVAERIVAVLAGFFAGLGLLLAAVGLYGVMAYMVTQRTNEIGIRMALGASPSRIAALVVREALVLTAGGLVVGIACALLLSRSLASMLFGLTPGDPLTLWSVAALMVVTGLVTAYLPSRRAARLEPTAALRTE